MIASPELRLGRWQDVLADVEHCDAVIADPPYGARTHEGVRVDSTEDGCERSGISYASWSADDVTAFVDGMAPRCSGWFCAMTSHDLVPAYEAALEAHDRYVFKPLPLVIKGMNCRLSGDGPSSWSVMMVVARPRSLNKWGTLPGAYIGVPERGLLVTGGKPAWLMRAIIRDYTRPGDLVVDPCAGGATTLLAAAIEGRRAIGAEMDPETYRKAQARLKRGYTPTFDWGSP